MNHAMFVVITLLLCFIPIHGNVTPQLPRLSIDPSQISISGLSSGADFATQFAVAFSKTVMGLGVFAGQPFHCAVTAFPNDTLIPASKDTPYCDNCPKGKTVPGDHCKGKRDLIHVDILAEAARRMSDAGLIDDVKNLARTKVYTYCGTKDGTLGGTEANRDFFRFFTPEENIKYNFTTPSGHCWPQATGLFPCRVVLKNFWPAENCHYDGPGELLNHVYGKLNPPASEIVPENLHYFDQKPFNLGEPSVVGLTDKGWIYIPKACQEADANCRLHLSLHGCSELYIFEEVLVRGSKSLGLSFNRWAETNKIVVLWPHVGPHGGRTNKTRAQSHGCWDGYGQTSHHYDTKEAIQMQVVRSMIRAVAGI